MNRSRALILSLGVGVAAVAGVFAATSTISLGSEAKASTDKQVAQRTAQLDRYEASLQKALAKEPPRLPAMQTGTAAAAGVQTTLPARVVYRRAAPVVVGQTAGSDEEYEHEDDEYEHGNGYEDDHDEEHGDGRESDD
jgi:hypothetical protein